MLKFILLLIIICYLLLFYKYIFFLNWSTKYQQAIPKILRICPGAPFADKVLPPTVFPLIAQCACADEKTAASLKRDLTHQRFCEIPYFSTAGRHWDALRSVSKWSARFWCILECEVSVSGPVIWTFPPKFHIIAHILDWSRQQLRGVDA